MTRTEVVKVNPALDAVLGMAMLPAALVLVLYWAIRERI